MKFNVDGASVGNLGPFGIVDVLKNHDGSVLLKFSRAISEKDSNLVEILAIEGAFRISTDIIGNQYSKWFDKCSKVGE